MDVPVEVQTWMRDSAPKFPFAASLLEFFECKGFLTERQIAAAQTCIAKRAASLAQRHEQAPDANLGALEVAFKHARDRGAKRIGFVVADLKFSPAREDSANPGAIYAKVREEGTYLGKFMHGKFMRASACTDERQAQLLEIAKDPLNAALQHGRMTGECAVCSRELTDPESIERGIGPVCAEKFGW